MNISYKIKQGMLKAVTGGRISVNAPLGYSHTLIKGERTLSFNEKTPMVKEAFELYGTGEYGVKGLSEMLEWKYNLPIVRSTLYRVLQNPFYYGKMSYQGRLYDHNYETIVTKELFDRVQDVLKGNTTCKREIGKLIPYLYRRLLRCILCDSVLTPERAKKRWIYYKCHRYRIKHPFKGIKEETISASLLPVFEDIGIETKIFENPMKMRLATRLIFDDIWGNEDGTIGFSLKSNIHKLDIAGYINHDHVGDSENIKQAIKKEITTYTHPILKLCVIPRTMDEICQELKQDFMDVQTQLFDLQLNDKIIEDESGRWKSL